MDWTKTGWTKINWTKRRSTMLITIKAVLPVPQICIGTDTVMQKISVKYLGLNVDNSVKFNIHIILNSNFII